MNAASFRPDLGRIGGRALVEVLDTLVSLAVIEMRSSDDTAAGSAGAPIVATMELSGERASGAVQLCMPRAFAERVARRLHGKDGAHSLGAGEVDDLAGELCNMVAGRVAAQMSAEGYCCGLGTPSIVRETPSRLAAEQGADVSRTDWDCGGHPLRLEIQLRYRPT